MKPTIAVAVLLAGLCSGLEASWAQKPANPPAAAVAPAGDRKFDFTPTVSEQVSDGVPYRTVLFRDGSRRMQVNPPGKWTVSGSPGEMFFLNPDLSGARITLRASSLPVPEKMDEPWIESIKPLVIASLPKSANNQVIANVAPNAINISSSISVEFKATYDQTGKRFVSDWVFLRLTDGRLLEVVTSSRDEDFPAVRSAMIEVLRGWGTAPYVPGSP